VPRAKAPPRTAPSPAGNRTDRTVPAAVPPGLTYGQRQVEQAGQQSVPVGQPPGPPTGAPVPTSAAGGPQPDLPAQAYNPPPGKAPGELPWLHPTNRPHEPITAGMPVGPGGGPEILQGIGALAQQQGNESGSLKQLLGSMAATPGASTAIKDLASTAGAG
jgi:hypothetical protein